MAWAYGANSLEKLGTIHPDLSRVAYRALDLQVVDITIVWGWRNEDQQNAMHDSNVSKVRWPNSKHNAMQGELPMANAMDLAPYINGAIPWSDEGAFLILAGVVMAAAAEEGVELRYGGDWDRDGLTEDQTFMDLGHFERVI